MSKVLTEDEQKAFDNRLEFVRIGLDVMTKELAMQIFFKMGIEYATTRKVKTFRQLFSGVVDGKIYVVGDDFRVMSSSDNVNWELMA